MSLDRKEIPKTKLLEFLYCKGRENLISYFYSLFIEVWCLENKLGFIRYELGQIFIPKK